MSEEPKAGSEDRQLQAAIDKYEDHFVAYVDLLGFSEASGKLDEQTRVRVLGLLLAIATLRSDFRAESEKSDDGSTRWTVLPAVSTFSDNIVISYALTPLAEKGMTDDFMAITILNQFTRLMQRIAAVSLPIGFLVRGGATIGKLYHANGVLFGEALVEAYQIESRVASYPRIILSKRISDRASWWVRSPWVFQDDDGLYCIDYLTRLVMHSAVPGEDFPVAIKSWLMNAVSTIQRNLRTLEQEGRLGELAKWTWFKRKFRTSFDTISVDFLKAFGISLDDVPWDS